MTDLPEPGDRARALALLEAAEFMRDAHFRDGLTVQEITTALAHTVDRADAMVGSLARDGFGAVKIAEMLSADAPAVSSAVVAPPTDHTTPSHRAGLREQIAAEIWAQYPDAEPSPAGLVMANPHALAAVTLAVLYREWPWLRAEAEDAAPTDHTTPPAWVDGHPQLEAIAAAVWEQCGRSDNGACVDDDPRNIAVAALSAVRNTADDQAAENKRLRAKVFEWQGSYLDEVKVRQERDAEIARLRADRAAVLHWAAAVLDQRASSIDALSSSDVGEEARAVRELAAAANDLRRLAADDEQPGARHVHITIHHPDPTTARTAARAIADLVHGEYSDSLHLTITTDAPDPGAAPSRPADETPDTTPQPDLQVWPLRRILTEVRCGSADWSWDEEWADLDRRHAETGYLDTLEAQIRERGITMPVLIGSDGRLWDGHHRLRIAVRAGIEYVPVEIVLPAAGARQDGAPDDVVTELTEAEFHDAAGKALARLGLTYAELEDQARRRDFSSAQARSLWVTIGGAAPAGARQDGEQQ